MKATIRQMKHVGQDKKAEQKFWNQQYKAAKKLGKSDAEARELADFMLDYYGHHFRKYV